MMHDLDTINTLRDATNSITIIQHAYKNTITSLFVIIYMSVINIFLNHEKLS